VVQGAHTTGVGTAGAEEQAILQCPAPIERDDDAAEGLLVRIVEILAENAVPHPAVAVIA
jgi:hypothetical protein